MIERLEFNDFRMFKGNQVLDIKPITLFIGPNNSGKSTLIKLLKHIIKMITYRRYHWKYHEADSVDYFGEWTHTSVITYSEFVKTCSEFDSVCTEYQKDIDKLTDESGANEPIKQFMIDEIAIRGDGVCAMYTSVHYIKNNICLATEEPNFYTLKDPEYMGKKDPEYMGKLTIHFENIFNNQNKIIHGRNEKIKEISHFLKIIQELEFPQELYRTNIRLGNKKLPLFSVNDTKGKNLEIRLYEQANSEFIKVTSAAYLSHYLKDIIVSIMQNDLLSENYRLSLSNVLEFIIEEFILSPLYKLEAVDNKIMSFSAYRGQFINEKNSQANDAIKALMEDKSYVFEEKVKREEGRELVMRHFYKEYYEFLKKWLQEFEIGEGLIIDDKQLDIFKIILEKDLERFPFELGFGNQQLLPLVLGLLNNLSGITIIEEPESHLHPYLQSKLADFFVDAIQFKKDLSTQLIIETHSEYLIRKLQYLVANKSIRSEDVAIYYINRADQIPAGARQIQKMEIMKDGSFNYDFGPGFFDEAVNLKIELLKLKNAVKN
ncbi:MAG: AAA family ATPase [Bacteroidales bacterium]|jgi:predicted ATPase|nr:DUF3696 domain-containing protein [Bacteroidales bacterium]OQA64854.1 MAG: hypothetical protein BWY38_02890 [Ignavibacteria bacterium ADurb.Bin266]